MEAMRPYLMIVLACILLAKIGVTITHKHEFSNKCYFEHSSPTYGPMKVEHQLRSYDKMNVDVTHHGR